MEGCEGVKYHPNWNFVIYECPLGGNHWNLRRQIYRVEWNGSLTYPNIFPSSQRSGISDVQIRAPVCELSGENFPRADINSDPVKSRPRDPVPMQGVQLSNAAGQKVHFCSLFVQTFWKKKIFCLRPAITLKNTINNRFFLMFVLLWRTSFLDTF